MIPRLGTGPQLVKVQRPQSNGPNFEENGIKYFDVDVPLSPEQIALQERIQTGRAGFSDMLILTRKINQKIIVDGRFKISITEINRDEINLSIIAPDDCPIFKLNRCQEIEVPGGCNPEKPKWDLNKIKERAPLFTVKITEIDGSRIRLGFEAPKEVNIKREEICEDPPNIQGTPFNILRTVRQSFAVWDSFPEAQLTEPPKQE